MHGRNDVCAPHQSIDGRVTPRRPYAADLPPDVGRHPSPSASSPCRVEALSGKKIKSDHSDDPIIDAPQVSDGTVLECTRPRLLNGKCEARRRTHPNITARRSPAHELIEC
jgi:hypothetical protein